jgi:HSP20 family protein
LIGALQIKIKPMSTTNGKTRNGYPFYQGIFNAPSTFNKVFGELLEGSGVEFSYGKFPAVNIAENQEKFIIETIVPGFEKEEIKISLENGNLKISGEKKTVSNSENENYSKREFKVDKFTRSFVIPENINSEAIEAEYKNGVLYLNLPKLTVNKESNIEISIK